MDEDVKVVKVELDSLNRVVGFADIGGPDTWLIYTGDVPDGFRDNCWAYRMQNGVLAETTREERENILRGPRFGLTDTEIAEILSGGVGDIPVIEPVEDIIPTGE